MEILQKLFKVEIRDESMENYKKVFVIASNFKETELKVITEYPSMEIVCIKLTSLDVIL